MLIVWQSILKQRGSALRTTFLILANNISIGLRSGEQEEKISVQPRRTCSPHARSFADM